MELRKRKIFQRIALSLTTPAPYYFVEWEISKRGKIEWTRQQLALSMPSYLMYESWDLKELKSIWRSRKKRTKTAAEVQKAEKLFLPSIFDWLTSIQNIFFWLQQHRNESIKLLFFRMVLTPLTRHTTNLRTTHCTTHRIPPISLIWLKHERLRMSSLLRFIVNPEWLQFLPVCFH